MSASSNGLMLTILRHLTKNTFERLVDFLRRQTCSPRFGYHIHIVRVVKQRLVQPKIFTHQTLDSIPYYSTPDPLAYRDPQARIIKAVSAICDEKMIPVNGSAVFR